MHPRDTIDPSGRPDDKNVTGIDLPTVSNIDRAPLFSFFILPAGDLLSRPSAAAAATSCYPPLLEQTKVPYKFTSAFKRASAPRLEEPPLVKSRLFFFFFLFFTTPERRRKKVVGERGGKARRHGQEEEKQEVRRHGGGGRTGRQQALTNYPAALVTTFPGAAARRLQPPDRSSITQRALRGLLKAACSL